MVKEAIATAETVEAAKEAALKELAPLSFLQSYVQYETIKEPTKKILGMFGGSPAEVKASLQVTPAQIAAGYLKEIFAGMGLHDVEITIEEEEGGALLCVNGDDIGFVIGHRGDTLDSLQYLAGLVANHAEGSYYRITLDIGAYREKRRETLETLGRKMAIKAVKMGHNFSLEPMNPYERRIIHTAVQKVEGAKSWSEGEDIVRHVVIGPEAGEKPRFERKNHRSDNRHGGKSGGHGRAPRENKPTTPAPAPEKTASAVKDGLTRIGKIDTQRPARDMGDKPMSQHPDYAIRPRQTHSDDESLPLYGRINK